MCDVCNSLIVASPAANGCIYSVAGVSVSKDTTVPRYVASAKNESLGSILGVMVKIGVICTATSTRHASMGPLRQ